MGPGGELNGYNQNAGVYELKQTNTSAISCEHGSETI